MAVTRYRTERPALTGTGRLFQEEDYGRKTRVPPETKDSFGKAAGMPKAFRAGLRIQEDGEARGSEYIYGTRV